MAAFTVCNNKSKEFLRAWTHQLACLLDSYKWLTDSYVSDFYTENHWEKLPRSLQDYFDKVEPSEIAWLLVKNESHDDSRPIPPLILLALHCCLQTLSLHTTGVDIESPETQKAISSALVNNSQRSLNTNNGLFHSEAVINTNCIPLPNYKNGQCLDMDHLFRKHVKPKKQHEINKLGQAVKLLSLICDCNQVIDVGAGLGHLSRLLTFQHGLQTTTVEASDGHAPKAAVYDKETKKDIYKANKKRKKNFTYVSSLITSNNLTRNSCMENHSKQCSSKQYPNTSDELQQYFNEKQNEMDLFNEKAQLSGIENGALEIEIQEKNEDEVDKLPSHIICKIDPDIGASQFMDVVQIREGGKCVLVGLHACGDLTPTLLRVFVQCPTAVGLASVACCYMKLSGKRSAKCCNFPMSNYVKSLKYSQLSYVSRELACHFADAYYQRIKSNSPHLKIHSYRAALQGILKTIFPQFKNGDYRLVCKKGTKGNFIQYATDVLQKIGVEPNVVSHAMFEHCEMLTTLWKRVVAFYCLRLSLAPLVETYILLDRSLFLHESGISSVLIPIFDSSISPRNFALLALK